MDISREIRNYVFVPKGETVRAFEVTVLSAVAFAVPSKGAELLDWKVWALGVAAAGLEAGVGFIKGKLTPKSAP